jgi:hypothetical protein
VQVKCGKGAAPASMRAGACINEAASARTGAVQLAGAVERDGGVRIYAGAHAITARRTAAVGV